MKRPYFIVTFLVMVLSGMGAGLCLTGPGEALAKDPKPSEREIVKEEKELEDLERRLRETRDTLKEFSTKETGVLGELDRINRDFRRERDALKKVEVSLKRIGSSIKKTDRDIRVLEDKRVVLNERLATRVRALYKINKGGLLSALFSSLPSTAPSAADTRRYKSLTLIMDSDIALLKEARINLESLERERRRLKSLRKDLTETRRSARLKKASIDRKRLAKKRFLSDIRKKKDVHTEMLVELEDAQKELAELISGLRGGIADGGPLSGFAAMKGRLPLPLDGTVVASYGKVTHPRFKTVTFNNGVLVEAPYGSEVRAVYRGRVVYVGWLKGYGQVMIMDHGSGFYTLFAHLSAVLRENGEEVRGGEVVALVGESGTHDAPALYFEVRQRGVPRDPMGWTVAWRAKR